MDAPVREKAKTIAGSTRTSRANPPRAIKVIAKNSSNMGVRHPFFMGFYRPRTKQDV